MLDFVVVLEAAASKGGSSYYRPHLPWPSEITKAPDAKIDAAAALPRGASRCLYVNL